jgi:hypothetical protein
MDLSEFVAQVLVQLVDGVTKAQKTITPSKIVNPLIKTSEFLSKDVAKHGMFHTGEKFIQMVDFEIALTVGNEMGADGKAKVAIGVLGIGFGGGKKSNSESVSKLRFSVPIALPVDNKI